MLNKPSVSVLPGPPDSSATLSAIALLFLRLGLTAFGGPAAHIAMMQREVVERRKWIDREQFLDLLGAANLIPGPSSTELAILIGYRLAGSIGLLLAGICFILPAFLLVMGIAWAYVKFGHLPQVGRALAGVKPVVIAIISTALWQLGRTAIKTLPLAFLSLAALGLALLGAGPLSILLGAGLLAGAARWLQGRCPAPSGPPDEGSAEHPQPRSEPARKELLLGLRPLLALASVLTLFSVAPLVLRGPFITTRFGLGPLFCVFVKIGSVIYGSGYVLLAFLRSDLVTQRGWLTSAQLIDAVSVGQVTPGPVFTTATFIGFILGGPAGAIVATAAIFLPAFLFVAISGPFMSRARESPISAAFLDGVTAASLALMASVTWELSRAALIGPLTIVIACTSLLVLLRFAINPTWLIAAGAALGLAFG